MSHIMGEPIPLLQEIAIPLIFFCIALTVRSVFSFLETTITALRLFKLKELARITSGRYEQLFHTLEKNPHKVIITTLIASNVADVTSGALATHITETIFTRFNLPGGLGLFLGIGVASIALIFFGEIIPKNLARARGEKVLSSMLWLINGVFYALQPLAAFLTRLSDFLIYRIEGKKPHDKTVAELVASEQEIKFLIEYIHSEGLIEQEKGDMLRNIFELGNTAVKNIAVPAPDIISINIETPLNDALKIFSKYRLTRLPVYQKNRENIVGMAHLKDIFVLVFNNEQKCLKEIVRPIMFIQESEKVSQLLRKFRQQHQHIAIILNDINAVTGLITLEDVLEEIVGDINDEHEIVREKS
ncbi:MAG: hemolysin family protein [Candidatus Dependentiae bacterium]|nr:hemolysin family protein [Candidatus Dependentiae bacterium]